MYGIKFQKKIPQCCRSNSEYVNSFLSFSFSEADNSLCNLLICVWILAREVSYCWWKDLSIARRRLHFENSLTSVHLPSNICTKSSVLYFLAEKMKKLARGILQKIVLRYDIFVYFLLKFELTCGFCGAPLFNLFFSFTCHEKLFSTFLVKIY